MNPRLFFDEFAPVVNGNCAEYDHPVVDKELDGVRVLHYEAWGIPKSVIKCEREFINKTKKSFLNITGEAKDERTGFENDINIHLPIDTDIYNKYEVHIADGMITVVLIEIPNEAPILEGGIIN